MNSSQQVRATRHWVTIVAGLVAGLSLVSLASVSDAQAASVTTSGVYENGSAAVTLHGPWTTKVSTQTSGGTFSNLAAAGYAQLSFTGTGVRWTARTNSSAGVADVYIDGGHTKSVDLYSAQTSYKRVVYAISGLRQTTHTIRVVRTGRKNAASVGRNVMVDAFTVLDSRAPSAPTQPISRAERTGARVDWTASPQADVAGYRIYRQPGNAGASTLLGTTAGRTVTSFLDIGLNDSSAFTYRIVAVDLSGNASTMSRPTTVTTPAAPAVSRLRFVNCPAATVSVSNRSQLVTALTEAHAGTVIWMSPGKYSGQFDIAVKATPSAPAWLCGPRTAVIDGGASARRGGLRIDSSSNLVVAGMTVRNSLKGIAVLHSTKVTVADTRVEDIGDEAIHLLNFTTDSTVVGNSIHITGLVDPQYGEGVYIGTADANWCLYSGCQPDRSDRNQILSNDISRTTAEPIEAKVATSGGTISHNTINGLGMRPTSYALIYVKGNDWVVSHNTGRNSSIDGVLVIQRNPGWGLDNIVFDSQFYGSIPGYGVHLDQKNLGNIVGCGVVTGSNSIAATSSACQL
jgi:hypothetical protein